eukprot:291104-Pyramimonas_sp.AAC.1
MAPTKRPGGPERSQDGPQMPPMGAPGGPQETPRRPQETPPRSPRGAQDAPRGLGENAKSLISHEGFSHMLASWGGGTD